MARNRSPSEILRRGYSDEELAHLYELGRFLIETGDLHGAEQILHGITEVAPDYLLAWAGRAVIALYHKNYDLAQNFANQAWGLAPDSVEALLLLISAQLSLSDFNSAGTHLGEVGEKIDSGQIENPNLVRYFRAQLARYQTR